MAMYYEDPLLALESGRPGRMILPDADPSSEPLPPTPAQTPAPTPAPTATSVWDTPPADGNWEAWFNRNIAAEGLAPTTANYLALEPKLAKHGIKLGKNASGEVNGKLILSDGAIVDVLRDYGGPNMAWQWLTGVDGDTAGATATTASGTQIPVELVAPLLEPWTEPFTYPGFVAPESAADARPDIPGFQFEDFQAPTAESIFEDPGFMTRLRQGQQALEQSAAARGTLLTGGTLKGLMDFSQQLASQEYGNVYNRRAGEYGTRQQNRWQEHQDLYGKSASEYERDYAQALSDYERRYNISMANQDRPFNKLTTLAGLGQVTTPYMNLDGNLGNLYTQGAGAWNDYLLQGANARAAGQMGSANAWSGAMGPFTNSIWNGLFLNTLYGNRGVRPPTNPGYVPGTTS